MQYTVNEIEQGQSKFLELTEELLADPRITRSTMMGYPCVRYAGAFFASSDRGTGELMVKLPTEMVNTMIDAGHGSAFAPAGRHFKEWVAIPYSRFRTWRRALGQALRFAGSDESD